MHLLVTKSHALIPGVSRVISHLLLQKGGFKARLGGTGCIIVGTDLLRGVGKSCCTINSLINETNKSFHY